MLEITGDHIKELNDTDLRSLIGYLCEAELSSTGIPIAGVTWGGHQNASDGGIDVRVDITTDILDDDSFVPRSKTGFQVKKPDMPRSGILQEMRPNGELRQVIKDLADNSGAYIIVSSQGSTADSALKNRKDAMREALSDYMNETQIKTDYYDRDRVAGWVRSHPSLTLWVRDKIGQPIQGWKSYGNWANCPGGVDEEYVLDGHTRLHKTGSQNLEGLSVIDGINQLRNILKLPGSSVRLVGLSGVGKTRLIQSLFDERIAEKPLNKTQVFYSDISDNPNPDPRNFAERLIAFRKPLILIIDNCPPDLHRRLTSICSASGSLISLITVEYDVRDDQPEETEVFRLEPASNEIIEKVILARFAHVDRVGAKIIAESSGGNARIAIALARTIERGEDISRLRDQELFERLFIQRNVPDSKLLKAAEVCSLVYSFDCNTNETNDIELRLLGSLINMSVNELYENVSELKRRDLIQQRSKWRAVLPHAVANRLAERALQNIPIDNLVKVFEQGGSERLLQSFSRRLGFLHNSEIVKGITERWLSEEGLLGDIKHLNELGINMFRNIAPVDPNLTLSVIERVEGQQDGEEFFTRKNDNFPYFTKLLRSIAYDKELFDRAIQLLCKFALTENPEEKRDSTRKLLKSLFYIKYSGTHAIPEQRLNFIASLLEDDVEKQNILGVSLLSSSLESWHFNLHFDFEFGNRVRNFGYSPHRSEDVHQWYKTFLDYSLVLAVSDKSIAPKILTLLAENFRGLWSKAEMYDELETVIKVISAKGNWNRGWLAVKSTIRFDGKNMTDDLVSRLETLAGILEPTTLIDRIRLYTLSGNKFTLDLIDTVEEEDGKASVGYKRVDEITRILGQELASQYETLNKLLPDLLSSDGIRIFYLGQGLAEGGSNPREMWNNILQQISLLPEINRNYQLLRGFLNVLSRVNNKLCEEYLNEAVTNEILSNVFPIIQNSVPINIQGLVRLNQSIDNGTVPIQLYRNLAYGRSLDSINDSGFCELMNRISSKTDGIEVAMEILQVRIHGETKNSISELIVSLGQDLLIQYSYSLKNTNHLDYILANIIELCFANESSMENAKIVAEKILNSLEKHVLHSSNYSETLGKIATLHPLVFLDVFLAGRSETNYILSHIFSEEISNSLSPISCIDDEVIIEWCKVDSEIRYPIIASAIIPYRINEKEQVLKWTPLAMTLITNSSDPVLVLSKFKSTFRPSSWSGSRSEIMQTRLSLLIELQKHENIIIANWASQEEKVFVTEIRSERDWELSKENGRNKGFE